MIIAVSIGGIDWMKEGETSANILVGPNYSLLCCVFDEHPPEKIIYYATNDFVQCSIVICTLKHFRKSLDFIETNVNLVTLLQLLFPTNQPLL